LNFKPDNKDEIDLNLTPLIDVVFLLLIFFMVSTTFDKQAKLNIVLPEASSAKQEQQAEAIVVAIDASGNFYINDRQLVNAQARTLKLALVKVMGNRKNPPVILRADAKTTHESVVRVMDTLAQMGLTKLSIATLETQSN